MEKKCDFCVIGGDLRQIELARGLLRDGHSVRCYGFDKYEGNVTGHTEELKEALSGKYVVLPLPMMGEDNYITMPYGTKKVKLGELFSMLSPSHVVMGGRIDDNIRELFRRCGIKIYDYFEREELAILNAAVTAEGAVQIAMEELPIVLGGASVLITGFGRISKLLSNMLRLLGARVEVCARKHSDRAWIKALGLTPRTFSELPAVLKNYNVIFNTVPSMVLGEEELMGVDPQCLIIDLASRPGGVDFEAARRLSIRTVWALSLPGRVAPVSAGRIIKDTLINIIEELEG